MHKGEIAKADCQSLCSTAILKELNSMAGSNADKIKLSIDNQVLHNLTALIASERLMDSTSKESILVEIPMNKPKQPSPIRQRRGRGGRGGLYD